MEEEEKQQIDLAGLTKAWNRQKPPTDVPTEQHALWRSKGIPPEYQEIMGTFNIPASVMLIEDRTERDEEIVRLMMKNYADECSTYLRQVSHERSLSSSSPRERTPTTTHTQFRNKVLDWLHVDSKFPALKKRLKLHLIEHNIPKKQEEERVKDK